MADVKPIRPADLVFDTENPRLSQPNSGQREAYKAIAAAQQKKLQALAQDIVENGTDPSQLPIVMQLDEGRYVVLEGNRRLAAIRALENPDSLVDVIPTSVLQEVRKLSKAYQEDPVDAISCLVVKDRDEARHWIELRHTGENEGAGLVRWGADEAARFKARSGVHEPHLQVLDFLETEGHLAPAQRRQLPTTSFRRLVGTPEVRSKLGIEISEGKVQFLAPEEKVAKVVLHLIDDLASGRTKTQDIYTKPQRVKYANKLPKNLVIKPSDYRNPTAIAGLGGTKPKRAASPKPITKRDRLIPKDCILNVTNPRVRQIEIELRDLSLDNHTNAVAVLFRVFIELSADTYIGKSSVAATESSPLGTKLNAISADLVAKQKLTQQQAAPARRAAQKDSFLAPSITLMHAYVHNPHVFPTPTDLRNHWNSLQPFLTALWA